MFIDQNSEQQKDNLNQTAEIQNGTGGSFFSDYKLAIIAGGVFLVVLIASLLLIFYLKSSDRNNNNQQAATSTNEAVTAGTLPAYLGNSEGNGDANSQLISDIKAEVLSFGDFYQKIDDGFKPSLKSYSLPINVKSEVSNYYEISRKIDFDQYVEQINQNGFAVMDNQFTAEANDYFSTFRLLANKEIPVVLTGDFLFYYYQDSLKDIFAEIERSIFYENMWDISKGLFDKAVARYNERLIEVGGMSNDRILEAERLEAAYFATALKMLTPDDTQINKNQSLDDSNMFSPAEADAYDFEIPEFLKDDVAREIALVKAASKNVKSPVLLYNVDYKNFSVPSHLADSAKLSNFYLATRWFNSAFPLYYKDANCEDCLLDYDDWARSMIAASLIAEDFYNDQTIKNQWAVIYKVFSFFSGLRQDLTYLNYYRAMKDVFGDNYNTEDIFSSSNDDNLVKLRDKISEQTFSLLEGGYDRADQAGRASIGMRLFQEDYWPNDYIFDNLTGGDFQVSNIQGEYFTACKGSDRYSYYRCRGFGLDVVNLIYPNLANTGSDYFAKNTSYSGYQQAANGLKATINSFNNYSLNNNTFWSTLDIAKIFLGYNSDGYPAYAKTSSWKNEKNINTVLGAWVNLHTPSDNLISYYGSGSTGLNSSLSSYGSYNYVEPNLPLVQELIARSNMLMGMFNALGITDDSNSVLFRLNDLISKLQNILDINKKELSGESLAAEDYEFINDFVKGYEASSGVDKEFAISISGKESVESVDGIKLLVLVYEIDGKKVLAVGPIFNYSER